MKIGSEIYVPIRDAGRTIADSAFNIARLRRAIPGRMDVWEPYISNADNVLLKTEVSYHECEDFFRRWTLWWPGAVGMEIQLPYLGITIFVG